MSGCHALPGTVYGCHTPSLIRRQLVACKATEQSCRGHTDSKTRLHRQEASSTSRGSFVRGHLKSMPTTSLNATSNVSTAVSPPGCCVWSMKGFLWRSQRAAWFLAQARKALTDRLPALLLRACTTLQPAELYKDPLSSAVAGLIHTAYLSVIKSASLTSCSTGSWRSMCLLCSKASDKSVRCRSLDRLTAFSHLCVWLTRQQHNKLLAIWAQQQVWPHTLHRSPYPAAGQQQKAQAVTLTDWLLHADGWTHSKPEDSKSLESYPMLQDVRGNNLLLLSGPIQQLQQDTTSTALIVYAAEHPCEYNDCIAP